MHFKSPKILLNYDLNKFVKKNLVNYVHHKINKKTNFCIEQKVIVHYNYVHFIFEIIQIQIKYYTQMCIISLNYKELKVSYITIKSYVFFYTYYREYQTLTSYYYLTSGLSTRVYNA